MARKRGRRRKKLMNGLRDRRGYSYLNEESLDGNVWRNLFGGGFGLESYRIMNEGVGWY